MAAPPSAEKVQLGTKLNQEFLGEEHLKELRKGYVSLDQWLYKWRYGNRLANWA